MSERNDIFLRACDLIEQLGHDAEVRSDYSGRGMFGDTCFAIVTDAGPAVVGWAVTAAFYEAHDDREPFEVFNEALRHVPRRTDSMGLSTVYY